MISDPRVLAGGGARGQNLVHLQKLGFCVKFSRRLYLGKDLSKSIHTLYLDHRNPVGLAFVP